jgi:predicted ATPase/DNA-binding SARP family transcriptional activator
LSATPARTGDETGDGTVGHIDFRLLGSMEVRVDGQPVPLPGAAERALLALLLLSAGRTVAATSLVDRLWSADTLPVDPVNALQTRVSKLRRSLARAGVDVVSRSGAGYRADVEPGSVDVDRFVAGVRAGRAAASSAGGRAGVEALAEYDDALALWRGDPLADFAAETWATVEAARLTQLRLAALTERAEVALALGRHTEVITDLGPFVAADPKHEALAALLMRALYRGGRQAEALEVYARTRTVLDDELGLEPSAALRALHQRVLRQDPALAAVPTPESPEPEPSSRRPGSARVDWAQPGAAQPSTNLPASVRPLIGRDGELAALDDLLGRSRVVSLVGPGGAGKTALAFAVAARLTAGFADGVWVTRLAPVTDSSGVALAVADALGVPLDGAAPTAQARDRLVGYLARRRLLLVLDNCEHVLDAAARLVDEILAGCPDVTVLATSREALAVPGEVQFALAPLAAPPDDAKAGAVLDFPAARLFVERARAVRGDLELADADLVAVARICQRLDGMPLALELAAARMSSLSVRELAERLDDRFTLLTAGPRTAEARQRTLRATVDWSHALLTDAERTVFRRVAVFRGGWTLAAAMAVVSDGVGNGDAPERGDVRVSEHDVLDLVGRLVERSMVTAEPGHPTRYRMLETLRQYAVERLAASGEQASLAARHAGYFRRFAEEAEVSLRGHGQRETLRRLRDEQPNLRAALAWLTADIGGADAGRVEEALRLSGALGLFWHLGRHVEGREVLRRVVATPGGSRAARARALQAVSLVERPRGCLVHPSPRCAETARESLELFAAEGDLHRAALSRVLLAVEGVNGSAPEASERLLQEADEQFAAEDDVWGHAVIAFVRLETYLKSGDEARALATGRAAVAAFRELDDPWGLSAVLYHLGWGLRQFGRYADAVPTLEEAIEVATSAGLFNTVQWALADLGVALLHLNQLDAARECFDRAGAASEEIGDGAGEVLAAYGEAVLARLAGDWSRAGELFTRALAGFEALGTPAAAGLALAGLARCDEQDGNVDSARERYEQVRALGEAIGEPSLLASALEGHARVAAARRSGREAQELLERARVIRLSTTRPAPPHERAELAAIGTTFSR